MQAAKNLRVQLAAAGLLLAALSFVWAAAGGKLVINGKVASNSVRLIDGKAYAPLTDVAKALNMVVARNGNTYELAVAGGADQVSGSRQGKIGDWLFTG